MTNTTLKLILNNANKIGSIVVGLASLDSYRRTFLKDIDADIKLEQANKLYNEVERKSLEIANKEAVLNQKLEQLQINDINRELLDSKVEIEHVSELMKNCVDKLNNPLLSDEVKSLSHEEFIKLADKHLDVTTVLNNSFNKLYEIINDINYSGNVFDKYFTIFNDFLSNSNSVVLGCVAYIFLSIAILLCLSSIVAALFGDFIIKYLKLEINIPKLAKYIQLRRQFQTYYIIFNIILIVVILLYVIFTNLYILFYLL